MKTILTSILLLTINLFFATANAQELRFGEDVYLGANNAVVTQAVNSDAFVAGESVTITAATGGSAHLAGRIVHANGEIKQNLYAAGYEVNINGAIGQSANVTGYKVTIDAPIKGAIRSTAAQLHINGDIDGSALLAANQLTLNSQILGDVFINAQNITFGEMARIGGKLTLTAHNVDDITIPAHVANAQNITRIEAERDHNVIQQSLASIIWGIIKGIIFIVIMVALIAALAPKSLANTRQTLLQNPLHCIGWGFVMLAFLLGSGILLALSFIGLLVVPIVAIVTFVMVFAGYVIGAYSLGVAIFTRAGKPLPRRISERALRGAVGALIVAIIALIPFIGWLVLGLLVFAGVGAMTKHLLRPTLFASTPN